MSGFFTFRFIVRRPGNAGPQIRQNRHFSRGNVSDPGRFSRPLLSFSHPLPTAIVETFYIGYGKIVFDHRITLKTVKTLFKPQQPLGGEVDLVVFENRSSPDMSTSVSRPAAESYLPSRNASVLLQGIVEWLSYRANYRTRIGTKIGGSVDFLIVVEQIQSVLT